MKTRFGSMPFDFWSSAAAARASSMVSSLTVIVASSLGSARIFLPWTLLRFSYRRTAMPRVASPQARSLNGLFGPSVSSRSFGPEPWTRTSPGTGPPPFGMVKVPGSAHSPEPTVTSVSSNFEGSA